MGICPKKFGPYFWGAIHLACLYADDINALGTFISSLAEVLPCAKCRVHFAQVLGEHPFPTTGTRSEVFEWSVVAHNIVNARLNKPQVTVDQALAIWSSGCDGEFDPKIDWVTVVLVLGLVALVLFLLRNK